MPTGGGSFFGHPKGLFYLAFTEAWERFSYYGMTALLALYMVNQLLLPGHVEHIGGFSGFRAAVESLFGPLSTQALASQIFGLYSGFVYFTPLLGGMIADRWIGQRNGVVIGALSMSAGHIAMTFDQSFLARPAAARHRLGFPEGQYLGAGGRPLSARGRSAADPRFHHLQHGNQHRSGRRTVALRSARASLWLALWLRHRRDLHAPRPCHLSLRIPLPAGAGGARKLEGTRLTAAERRIVFALIAVMIITIFQSTAFYQVFNVNPIWIQQHVALDVGGFRIPVPWYQSINSVFSILGVPLLFWIWRHQASRRREPDELAKIGIGAWIAAASNLILVAAQSSFRAARRFTRSGHSFIALDWESPSSTTGPRFSRWFRALRRPK